MLQSAVLLLPRHQLGGDGFQVRPDLFQAVLRLCLLLEHDALPLRPGLLLAAEPVQIGEERGAQLRLRRALPFDPGRLSGDALQVFLAPRLEVAEIGELAGAVEQGERGARRFRARPRWIAPCSISPFDCSASSVSCSRVDFLR